MANAPKLLLMDEPTAGMAPKERNELMALTKQLVIDRNMAVLFTEHSMDVVFAYADRMIVLARGRLIAEGKPLAHKAAAGATSPLSLEEALVHRNPVAAKGAVRAMHEIDEGSGATKQRPYSQKDDKQKVARAKTHVTKAEIQYFSHVIALKLGGPDGLIGKSDADIQSLIKSQDLKKDLKALENKYF
jgi:ABC-type multidrug transport system ATPase subunit